MKTYGQFCPLAQAAQLLCERWTLIIVRELLAGSTHFGELQKGTPRLSPSLLSSRLKQLTKAGVVEQRAGTPGTTYHLTRAGRDLAPIVESLGIWGHLWAPSLLSEDDLDAGLLMWDMRRSVDAGVLPRHRAVVQFEYSDAPEGARDWWLVSEEGEVDLCLSDPGYEVDLLIRCPLKTMTAVWACQRGFDDAVKARDIDVKGDAVLARKLQLFLRASGLARLGAQRAAHSAQADKQAAAN